MLFRAISKSGTEITVLAVDVLRPPAGLLVLRVSRRGHSRVLLQAPWPSWAP